MVIEIDRMKWEQLAICTQISKLLEFGIIEELQARQAHSEHTRNNNAARYYETYMLRSSRLYSRVSSDSPRPCITSTHLIQGNW